MCFSISALVFEIFNDECVTKNIYTEQNVHGCADPIIIYALTGHKNLNISKTRAGIEKLPGVKVILFFKLVHKP